MSSTIPTHFKFKPPNFLKPTVHNHIPGVVFSFKKFTKNPCAQHHHIRLPVGIPMLCSSKFSVLTRTSSDGGRGEVFSANKQSSASDVETLRDSSSSSNDGYVALFIRMLGLDNDPQDREQAVVALWKYSLGGKHCIDNIMKYQGTVNLIVNLLKSDLGSACEAAAGLLRVVSSINLYRDLVAGSGAIEEMTGLLTHSSLSSEVKEQMICTLWNLSVDEKLSERITSSEILPLLVKYLKDEEVSVKEAAAGVLANLTLSQSNHKLMVELGVIPKLFYETRHPANGNDTISSELASSHSITKPQILASSAPPNGSWPSPQNLHLRPEKLPQANYKKLQQKLKQKQEQQPSILEIERAIGAGIFRDRDTNSEAEEKTTLFDNVLKNSVGKNEGSVEKQLRETGEWLIDQTNKTSRSAGKQILMTMFVWIIPMWIFAFLVASGLVSLPFETPFLDDLIS